MNSLKFMLSVIFSRTNLTPLSDNTTIINKINETFKEEVSDKELKEELDIIIKEQMQWNDEHIDVPEDWELNDL